MKVIDESAFEQCNSLTSVTIPNSVTEIRVGAFSYCLNLASITIPNSVTRIGDDAFRDCENLASIRSFAVNPPECGTRTFLGVDTRRCILYVPVGRKKIYEQTPIWTQFVLITDEEESGIESVKAIPVGVTEVYNLNGVKVADSLDNLPTGIYVVREGSTVKKIAVR